MIVCFAREFAPPYQVLVSSFLSLSLQVGDGDKPANLPGRSAVVDIRNPGDRKYPPSPPPPTSIPPQLPGGYSNEETRVLAHSASFSPAHPKTSAGPNSSVNTSDDSAATSSSSEECANGGAHPTPTPLPYFFTHPMGRYVYFPDGQTPVPIPNQPGSIPIPHQHGSVPIPNQQSGPQNVSQVVSEPVMHARFPTPT